MAEINRFGDPISTSAASFRCAKCRELAGVVKVARAGEPVDMGPPIGFSLGNGRDSVVLDYFLGTMRKAADPETFAAVQGALNADPIDVLAIWNINKWYAPFYCPDCDLNYCDNDWNADMVMDGVFYDYTVGVCPGGHRHILDD